eukprot:scaffold34622_cov162-Amphora_coffeaeformis.AAC.6
MGACLKILIDDDGSSDEDERSKEGETRRKQLLLQGLLLILFAATTMIVNQRALLLAVAVAGTASAWTTQGVSCLSRQRRPLVALTPRYLAIEVPPENSSSSEEPAAVGDLTFDSEEQKKEVVGNLVADDEWEGLTLELTDLVRKSCTSSDRVVSIKSHVVEDIKSNARDFLGKDDYQVGDITKEVDARVKDEVAKLRGKEEYELGDFVLAMDELSKKYTEELTGKPYEPGDLSTHLDTNIKASVAAFCGKDEYEVGDLTREISKRIESRVGEFTGKDGYETPPPIINLGTLRVRHWVSLPARARIINLAMQPKRYWAACLATRKNRSNDCMRARSRGSIRDDWCGELSHGQASAQFDTDAAITTH